MGGILSVFKPENRYSSIERSLDKIDTKLRDTTRRLAVIEKRKKQTEQWTLAIFITSITLAIAYVAKLKQDATGLSHWEHFTKVLLALSIPAGLEALRLMVLYIFVAVMTVSERQKARLEHGRKAILKDLKDATSYERISRIIEKYDPDARASMKLRAAALATPPPALQARARRGGPPSIQAGAMLNFFQSTGQALSPMVDKLASMLADDPAHSAALRQICIEREALRQEVLQLKQRLSQYEDVYELQENQPPLLGAPVDGPPEDHSTVDVIKHRLDGTAAAPNASRHDANVPIDGDEPEPELDSHDHSRDPMGSSSHPPSFSLADAK